MFYYKFFIHVKIAPFFLCLSVCIQGFSAPWKLEVVISTMGACVTLLLFSSLLSFYLNSIQTSSSSSSSSFLSYPSPLQHIFLAQYLPSCLSAPSQAYGRSSFIQSPSTSLLLDPLLLIPPTLSPIQLHLLFLQITPVLTSDKSKSWNFKETSLIAPSTLDQAAMAPFLATKHAWLLFKGFTQTHGFWIVSRLSVHY